MTGDCAAPTDGVAKHLHTADAANDVHLAVDQADPRGVIPAVLQPFEAFEQQLLAWPPADVPNDSAHMWVIPVDSPEHKAR